MGESGSKRRWKKKNERRCRLKEAQEVKHKEERIGNEERDRKALEAFG